MTAMKGRAILFFIVLLAGILRFYSIEAIPHGLYIDEVSIGQNAYSILHTGKDEYGKVLPFFFQAFGEYKLPVYIYLTSLSIAIFGKTEFAVRFPSALFGTATVVVFYFFLQTLLLRDPKQFSENTKRVVPLLGAFLLAVTPWHIQFSRGGFETTIAVFLFLLGSYFLLKWHTKQSMIFFFLGTVLIITTMYTYSAFRVLTPVVLIVLFAVAGYKIPKERKKIATVAISNLILLLPLIIFSLSSSGAARFNEVSAFNAAHLSFLQKLTLYSVNYFSNYLSFFSSTFLFVSGDGIGRHTIRGIGPLFRWEFFALVFGIPFLFQMRNTLFTKITAFLLIISPLAAALTIPSPHLLRSLLLVIPLTAIVAFGITKLWELTSRYRFPVLGVIILIALFEFTQYLHLYYIHYPSLTSLDWGAEYKEMIYAAAPLQKQYPEIFINTAVGDVQEYIKFYDDDLRYSFVNSTWQKPKELRNKKVLYITTPDPKKNKNLESIPHRLITEVHAKNLNNDIFVQFWEI